MRYERNRHSDNGQRCGFSWEYVWRFTTYRVFVAQKVIGEVFDGARNVEITTIAPNQFTLWQFSKP
jgi:hypothetical protein